MSQGYTDAVDYVLRIRSNDTRVEPCQHMLKKLSNIWNVLLTNEPRVLNGQCVNDMYLTVEALLYFIDELGASVVPLVRTDRDDNYTRLKNKIMEKDMADIRQLVDDGCGHPGSGDNPPDPVANEDPQPCAHCKPDLLLKAKYRIYLLREFVATWLAMLMINYIPVHHAAAGGNIAQLRSFLGLGSRVDTVSVTGATALHAAVFSGREDIVDVLISAGCAVNVRDKFGWTPLMYAVSHGSSSVVSTLLSRSADPTVTDVYGDPIIAIAIARGFTDIVQMLAFYGR